MRQFILNCIFFFGNDDEYVDCIVIQIFNDFYDVIEGKLNIKGECFYLNMLFIICYVYFGKMMNVIFNGCLVGCVISDGILFLYGVDIYGLFVVIKLLGKLDQVKSGGILLNQCFLFLFFKYDEDIVKLVSFICSYFVLGGYYIQFNIVDIVILYVV